MLKKNNILIIALVIIINQGLNGQGISEFLEQVRSNHPGIIAARDLMTAGVAGYNTGNLPPGPEMEAGWFPGRPESIGTKTTWSVTQSFDFPTRYAYLKKLKETNTELANMEYDRTIVELMTESGIQAIEMIAELKRWSILKSRMEDLVALEDGYTRMLDHGEVTIIDQYKIKQQVIEMQNNLNESEERLIELRYYLDLVSGNHSAMINNATYPLTREPDMDTLFTVLKVSHPAWLLPDLRMDSADKEVGLTKSENLPSISLGFASEKVVNEDFTGPTVGLSIPLWENRGKVRYARAARDAVMSESSAELVGLENRVRKEHELMVKTRDNLKRLDDLDPTQQSLVLLNKALEAGEMSLTEYLMELGSFYHIEDTKLELEKKYYQLLFSLYDYSLKD